MASSAGFSPASSSSEWLFHESNKAFASRCVSLETSEAMSAHDADLAPAFDAVRIAVIAAVEPAIGNLLQLTERVEHHERSRARVAVCFGGLVAPGVVARAEQRNGEADQCDGIAAHARREARAERIGVGDRHAFAPGQQWRCKSCVVRDAWQMYWRAGGSTNFLFSQACSDSTYMATGVASERDHEIDY